MSLPSNNNDESRSNLSGEVARGIRNRVAGGKFKRIAEDVFESDQLRAESLLASLGGVRGMIETSVPGVIFLIWYAFTKEARDSAIAALVAAALFIVIRVVRKEKVMPAVYGIFSVLFCTLLTLLSGKGESFFLPGLWVSGAYFAGFLVSLFLRFPIVGFVAAVLLGKFGTWRKDPLFYQAGVWTTVIWMTIYGLRLIVQVPLFFAQQTEALGVAKLVMGYPLTALALFVTWRFFASIKR